MRRAPRILAIILTSLTAASIGYAAEFSTSVLKPTPVTSEGVISAAFPADRGRVTYYFSTTLQKGELLTQVFFTGGSGGEKRVEFALLDANANLTTAYWIQGAETQKSAARGFPIETPGPQLLRVTVSGPETDEFRVELGGRAFSSSLPPSSAAATPASQADSSSAAKK